MPYLFISAEKPWSTILIQLECGSPLFIYLVMYMFRIYNTRIATRKTRSTQQRLPENIYRHNSGPSSKGIQIVSADTQRHTKHKDILKTNF